MEFFSFTTSDLPNYLIPRSSACFFRCNRRQPEKRISGSTKTIQRLAGRRISEFREYVCQHPCFLLFRQAANHCIDSDFHEPIRCSPKSGKNGSGNCEGEKMESPRFRLTSRAQSFLLAG